MFRTSDKLSKQMGLPQDLPVDPANLPEAWPDGTSTAGLGYVASAGGRLSPVRVHYVQDPYYWATAPVDVAGLETLHRLERQGLAHQVRPGIWTHAARAG